MERAPRRQYVIMGVVIGLVLVGILITLADWRQVSQVLGQANWQLVPLALFFTALSYLCLSYGFASVNRVFGIPMGWRALLEVGFVSMTLSHLMSAAGYTLRVLLLRRRGLSVGDSLAATVVHSYLNNLALFALLPFGLLHLLLSRPLSTREVVGDGVALGLLTLGFVLAAAMLFVERARTPTLRAFSVAGRWILRRDVSRALHDLGSTLSAGTAVVRARPWSLVLPVALVAADWAFSLAALDACFAALGGSISAGVLVTGFAVGVSLGLLSMVPGGLGVQEGSMAGIYSLLGVPLEQALLASVLFRLVYYLVPFGVSLAFYWRLLRGVERENP